MRRYENRFRMKDSPYWRLKPFVPPLKYSQRRSTNRVQKCSHCNVRATSRRLVKSPDRNTRRFVSRGEIFFSIEVNGDALHGNASAVFLHAKGQQSRGPPGVTLEGQRVLP